MNILDFSECQSREDLYAVWKATFTMPSYFGENLDALSDILSELEEPIVVQCYPPMTPFPEWLVMDRFLEDWQNEDILRRSYRKW